MKEIWKKSSLFYKLIAIMLTVVMVGTSVYFHFDRKYSAKAEEPYYVARAYKDAADSSWTIIDDSKSVGNVDERKFAYVFCMMSGADIDTTSFGYYESGSSDSASSNADKTQINVSNSLDNYQYYIIKYVNFGDTKGYKCCYKHINIDPDHWIASTIPLFTWTSNTISAHITSGGVETPIEEGGNYVLKKGDSVTAEVKSTTALTSFSLFGDDVDLTSYASITPDSQSQLYTYEYTKTFNSDDNATSVSAAVAATNTVGPMTSLSCNYAYDTTTPTVKLTLGGNFYVQDSWYGSATSPIDKAVFDITSGSNTTYESNFNTITIGGEDKTNASVKDITINDVNVVEGANSISVYVKDGAGNEFPSQTYSFNIDNTKPVVATFNVGDKDSSNSFVTHTSGSITLSGTVTDLCANNEQGSGADKVYIKVKNTNNTIKGTTNVTPAADGSFTADLSAIIGSLADNNGTYNFEVYATDNVGNISETVSLNNITIDTINPVLTIEKFEQYNTANGSWEDVAPSLYSSGVYCVNKDIYSKIKYTVKLEEKNISNPVKAYNGDTLYDNFTFAGTDHNYYLEINTNTLSIDTPLALTVKTEDKAENAGNDLPLTPVKLVDSAIKVNITELTIGDTSISRDNVDDIGALIDNHNVKGQVTIKVKALSGFDINTITLTGTMPDSSVYEKTFTKAGGTITNSLPDSNGIHATDEIEFVLPEIIADNVNISSLNLYVKDDNNAEKNIPIGDLLYDGTDPEIEITNSDYNATQWYQEYKLRYNLISGTSAIESDLDSVSYTIDGTVNNVAVAGTTLENAETEDISESTSVAGTTVIFTAQDKATNSLNGGVFIVKVDKTAPQVSTINLNGEAVTESTVLAGTPSVTSKVTDNLTINNYVIAVKYNGEDYASSNVIVNKDGSEQNILYNLDQIINGKEIKDGKYTISIVASDKSGRTSNVSSTSFVIDNTAPVVTANITSGKSGKKNGYYNSDVTVRLTCTDNNFNPNAMTVTDNGSEVGVSWKTGNDMYYADITLSSEGIHDIRVSGKDKAGTAAVAKQVSFVIDKTEPTVSILLNGGQTYSESRGTLNLTGPLTINASVNDSNVDSGDLRVQVIKTVPDTATTTSEYLPTSERTFTFSDEADYVVNIYAVDKANNQGPTRTISFRVDTTAPQLTITGANGGTSAGATSVSFNITEAFWSDAKGTVEIYRKAGDGVDEVLYKTLTVSPTQRAYSLSELLNESGIYRFEFTAEDKVGHTATTSQKITVDRNKPEITLTGVKNYDSTDGAVSIVATIADEFYANKKVNISGTRIDATGKKTALSFSPYAATANPTTINDTFTEEGIYDITISATDIAGNVASNSVHFTIDTSAPIIGDLSKYDGKTFNKIDLDIDLDELVSDLTVCDVRMYLNGSEYDGISDIEDGSYTLLITAEDELGHTSEKSITFVLDTKEPIFIVTGVEDGEIRNDTYSIEVSLQLDEDTLDSVTLNDESVLIKNNVASINVTDKGEYELYMKAYDEAGNEAEQTITFTFGEESVATVVTNAVEKAASHWWMWVIVVAAIFAVGGFIFFILKRKKDNE